MSVRWLAGLLFLGVMTSASARPGIVLLRYRDFGPQAHCWQLLGMEWWQWEAHGDSDPKTKYPVWVVVYDGVSEDVVRRRYAVSPAKQRDFRYVRRDVALNFLGQEALGPELTRRLAATRKKILAALGGE